MDVYGKPHRKSRSLQEHKTDSELFPNENKFLESLLAFLSKDHPSLETWSET